MRNNNNIVIPLKRKSFTGPCWIWYKFWEARKDKQSTYLLTERPNKISDVDWRFCLESIQTFFKFFWKNQFNLVFLRCINKMILSLEQRWFESFRRFWELKSKVKQVRLRERLNEQCFHYDTTEFFEPITNSNKTSEKLLEESKVPTAAIEKFLKKISCN